MSNFRSVLRLGYVRNDFYSNRIYTSEYVREDGKMSNGSVSIRILREDKGTTEQNLHVRKNTSNNFNLDTIVLY